MIVPEEALLLPPLTFGRIPKCSDAAVNIFEFYPRTEDYAYMLTYSVVISLSPIWLSHDQF